MSFEEAQQAVETYFAAAWSATTIAYANVDFTPPGSGAWVRVTVENRDSRLVGLGAGRLVRHEGAVVVHVFVDDGTGVQGALGLADDVIAMFAGAPIAGFVFRTGIATFDDEDEPDARVVVTVPFWRDEVA